MRVYVLTEIVHYKNGGGERPYTIGVFDITRINGELKKRADWWIEHYKMQHRDFKTPPPVGKFGVSMWDDGMVVTLTAEGFDINK